MRQASHGEHRLPLLEKILVALRIRRIKGFLSAGGELIVDAGCGYNATFLRQVKERYPFPKLIGLDLSVNASWNDDRLQLREADMNAPLPLADGSVDIVSSLAVLEHLSEPLMNLKEIYRVLKPGGRLLLTTPSPAAKPILELMAFRLHILSAEEIRDHKKYFSKRDLREILIRAGFSSEKARVSGFLFGLNNFASAEK